MNDYVALPAGLRSAILNNSSMKFFLAHDASEISMVTETFKLNSRESELLGSLQTVPGRFSEILCFFGAERQILRLEPTAIEYWHATSHKKDCEVEQRAIRAHPKRSRFEVLKALARRFPHGAIDADPGK